MADRRLLVWTFASFHAAGFTLGVVVPAYASGGLSDALPAVGTLPGLAGYAYLWILSYFATRWVLTDDVVAETLDGSVRAVLLRGSAGGGLVGLGVLLGPLVLLGVVEVVDGVGNPRAFLFVTVVGGGVAVTIGVVFGLVFALLDLAALRVAGGLLEAEPNAESTGADVGPTRDPR